VDRRYILKRAEVSQGDIYKAVPSVFIPSRPITAVRRETVGGGKQALMPYTEDGPPPAGGFQWELRDTPVVSDGRLALAILLTHDCEIDKKGRDDLRLVALIRPWASISESAASNIRLGNRRRFFYLAPQLDGPALDESYVDFRRITTVRGSALPEAHRVLSLSDAMRDALREAFIRYVTRAEGDE
jgi:hypothetical protein